MIGVGRPVRLHQPSDRDQRSIGQTIRQAIEIAGEEGGHLAGLRLHVPPCFQRLGEAMRIEPVRTKLQVGSNQVRVVGVHRPGRRTKAHPADPFPGIIVDSDRIQRPPVQAEAQEAHVLDRVAR